MSASKLWLPKAGEYVEDGDGDVSIAAPTVTEAWKGSLGEVCPRLARAQDEAREAERERWRFASDDSWWFESPRLADMERTA